MTREEAISMLEQIGRHECIWMVCRHNEVYETIDKAIKALKKRPHGEWEFIGNNLFKCTNCGYIADADYLRKWKVHTYDAEFPTACLKFGADMRKERDPE